MAKTNSPTEKHDHRPLLFPFGFLWGAATSAYQVEGGNRNTDWWEWEQKNQPVGRWSAKACDQYTLFEEDFELAKNFNHNAHRLGIEWSRIEPTEGEFSQIEIEHYKKVLHALKDREMKVMVTLWHFTLPAWVTEKGGWENSKTPKLFARFVEKVASEYKELVDLWITVNEPGVYTIQSYYLGLWPPQKKSKFSSFFVYRNLAKAHNLAYKTIHKIIPRAQVGIANNVVSFANFHKHSLRENIAEWVVDFLANHMFYKLTGKSTHDFLGLNYYFNRYISFNGEASFPQFVDIDITKKPVSDLGWEIFPQGMFDVIMDFSDYHLPIFITENGLASTNDDRRCRFLISYLQEIFHAIQAGADVRGYFHWSLIDNFEWTEGFEPRFGLVEVDYATLARIPRPSAKLYAEIIRQNAIPHHFLRFIGHTVNVYEVLNYKGHVHGIEQENLKG